MIHDSVPLPTLGNAFSISGYTTYMIERFADGSTCESPATMITHQTRRGMRSAGSVTAAW